MNKAAFFRLSRTIKDLLDFLIFNHCHFKQFMHNKIHETK